jgi:uncharacterized protein (TIGR02117 family)
MRKLSRWLAALVLLALAALALGTLVPRPLFAPAVGGEGEATRILVLASSIHTDIAVPVAALALPEFGFLREAGLPVDNPNARWVLFGWGGKAFYVATPELTDVRLGPLLKSFTLDGSVLHVQVAGSLDETQPGIAAFTISMEGLKRLLGLTRATFADAAGAPIHLAGTGYGPTDTFFEAVGSFNALIGCNTWTAGALREAGLRTGWWNPLPQTLIYSLALYN